MKGQVEDSSRARLVAAAEAVIAEFGWVGTTSRRIAARAGLNLSLICYYFGGMDHLLRVDRRPSWKRAMKRIRRPPKGSDRGLTGPEL